MQNDVPLEHPVLQQASEARPACQLGHFFAVCRGHHRDAGVQRFGDGIGILGAPDLISDQYIRRERTDHHHHAFGFRAAVEDVGTRPDVEGGDAPAAAGDLRSLVDDAYLQGGSAAFAPFRAARRDLAGQIPQQGCLAVLRRRKNQRMHYPLPPALHQIRQDAVGDAGKLPRDPYIEAGNVAQMLYAAAAEYRPAGEADPVSAGDGDEAFAELFLHRIQRMIADQIEQPVRIFPGRLVRFTGILR
ncbi:hypothetical protein D3C73_1091530 [compost metagenome]